MILDLCAKYQLCSMNRSVLSTPRSQSHTWRTLMVPDWCGHSWCNGLSWYVILDLCAKFTLPSMNRSASRTPRPRSHTWRIWMVPNWILGGWGHSWHHGSSWYVIFYLCAKFQLSSMIIIVSRTLEDVDGSWLDSWRMGSSLTSRILIICDCLLAYQIEAL